MARGRVAGYFPVSLNVSGRHCLVVGGGPVAVRRAKLLGEAGARVLVVAAALSEGAEGVLRAVGAELLVRPFEPSDLDGRFLVVSATDDRKANREVVDLARSRGILANCADDPSLCDFILPAVVRRGNVQIAVSTGGASPALSRHLRRLLERLLPDGYAELAEALAAVRARLRQDGVRPGAEAWQAAIDEVALGLARAGDVAAAGRLIERRLLGNGPRHVQGGATTHGAQGPSSSVNGQVGRIVLVGAGPGDPELMTMAGQRMLRDADVVVYDRLVNDDLLGSVKAGARVIYVGKQPGGGPMTQEQINDLLCREAGAGRLVVRLKGGDPFVFGRGGEEALAAVRAGIPLSVIPGVSAAVAVPSAAGIPVTHRGLASGFVVLSGHDVSAWERGLDWRFLADFPGTLVFLMGAGGLPQISQGLIAAGLDSGTPAAVIELGTTPSQRQVIGTVETIESLARDAHIGAPATIVIGAVVRLAEQLSGVMV